MVVLKEKNSQNTMVFSSTDIKKAQKLIDGGKWVIETDKSSMLKAKASKGTKKKKK